MSRNTYTFSKTRLLVHVFLLVITAGGAILVTGPWEVYRYFKK